ncbi:MAG: hypothetical protein IPL53_18400 [Ignavibacteria bacterium]|nr:hypothetical protein [Ignavibacteria bacterium]
MKNPKLYLIIALMLTCFTVEMSFAQSTLDWVNRVNIGASSQTAYDVATDTLGKYLCYRFAL